MAHLGLIGKTLSHSFSRAYFIEKFVREGLPHRYDLYELPEISAFPALWHDPELVGVNVTIPYKEAVLPFLARLDASAAVVGAVNTILRAPDGLVGYNTDVYGLAEALHPWLEARPDLAERPALVLGTGGAAKAAVWVLQQVYHINKVWQVSRTPAEGQLSYADPQLAEVLAGCGLVVQASPVGMYPAVEAAPSLPYEAIGPGHACMDMVYNPENTKFMQNCVSRGALVQNGLAMLHAQADRAWEIWKPFC